MKTNFKPPKWLFIITLSIFAAQLFGQNTNKTKPVYHYALRAYLSFWDEKETDNKVDAFQNQIFTSQKTTDLFPTLSFSKLKKKGSFFEISLTRLNFSHDDNFRLVRLDTSKTVVSIPASWVKTNSSQIAVRFEWNFPVFFEKMGRFQPYIGISTDPSVYYLKIDPFLTGAYPSSKIELNNTISIIPRLIVNASSRLFFDLNMPVSAFSWTASYDKIDNPILPTYARRTTNFSSKSFPSQFNFRLGIGYRL